MNAKTNAATRMLLWIAVCIYTLCLPHLLHIYRFITARFSNEIAGRIPIVLLILLALVYLFCSLFKGLALRSILSLTAGTLISLAVIALVPNPNKHIHIPEYILLTWLFHLALSKDYYGHGVLLLAFASVSLLGVVDEIMQGIIIGRFYGWKDMLVNSLSAFIAVLSILSFQDTGKRDGVGWSWWNHIMKWRLSMGVLFYGALVGLLTCISLYSVKATGEFQGTYPHWLFIANTTFLFLGSVTILQRYRSTALRTSSGTNGLMTAKTACLWLVVPMAILMWIQALVVYAYYTQTTFN
jgi:VanZ family protein